MYQKHQGFLLEGGRMLSQAGLYRRKFATFIMACAIALSAHGFGESAHALYDTADDAAEESSVAQGEAPTNAGQGTQYEPNETPQSNQTGQSSSPSPSAKKKASSEPIALPKEYQVPSTVGETIPNQGGTGACLAYACFEMSNQLCKTGGLQQCGRLEEFIAQFGIYTGGTGIKNPFIDGPVVALKLYDRKMHLHRKNPVINSGGWPTQTKVPGMDGGPQLNDEQIPLTKALLTENYIGLITFGNPQRQGWGYHVAIVVGYNEQGLIILDSAMAPGVQNGERGTWIMSWDLFKKSVNHLVFYKSFPGENLDCEQCRAPKR
jgi:hypothetical protein